MTDQKVLLETDDWLYRTLLREEFRNYKLPTA